MSKRIQSIRGMHDVLPPESGVLRAIEHATQSVLQQYGYQEIRMPLLEQTELFKRSLGEVTDIVEKEMYTFEDRNGDSLTLRPEGTASCVRAGIQHGFLYAQPQRLWYCGPFFRHERPQKGRYRQFHQLGVETFGFVGPDIDAELIILSAHMWKKINLPMQPRLEINSLGSSQARKKYREILIAYLQQYETQLDNEAKQRLHTNPLRILDSKNPDLQEIIQNAPSLLEHLDAESADHFLQLQKRLDAANITYTINPRLVRGLDYYSKTVFEWIAEGLGAQATICAGGRYDGLVDQLGGKPCPAAGFAIGLERLASLLEGSQQADSLANASDVDVYMVLMGEEAEMAGLQLADQLRTQLPISSVVTNCGGGSIKSQMKRADKSKARLAFILGEDELKNQNVTVKYMREKRDQATVSQGDVLNFLDSYLNTQ
ncbi:MAG: histidine--tRNA ligase [Gammaproteobacteria bacterium]|nr:MAG: histidine--tRNA ligase [Gammaproteobacteria bacterium]QMU62639.1 MAG: histidine--tRNA ligase [Gammaproteobacteria bacterium]